MFESAGGSCRPQARDRVSGVGDQGGLQGRLSPECHPQDSAHPTPMASTLLPGAASCPVPSTRDVAAPVPPGTLPRRLGWPPWWLSTPLPPVLGAHLSSSVAAPLPQCWLHISCGGDRRSQGAVRPAARASTLGTGGDWRGLETQRPAPPRAPAAGPSPADWAERRPFVRDARASPRGAGRRRRRPEAAAGCCPGGGAG